MPDSFNSQPPAERPVTPRDALREVAAAMRWAAEHLTDDDPLAGGFVSSAARLELLAQIRAPQS